MTTVDVLMPYYGDVPRMRAAVGSVLAQDDPRWHLTVVDDGAEAGVPEWFASLEHPQVRYLRNDRNLGVTGNFNRCLALVEHELVVLMGCDDLLLPNYIRTVLAVHQDLPHATIIQPGVRTVDRNGEPTCGLVDMVKRRIYTPRFTGRLMLSGEDLAVSLLRGNWLYFPSLCWKAAALTSITFREDLRVHQDLAVLLELIQHGARLAVDDTVCFTYRRHAASESSQLALDGSRFVEAGTFFTEMAEQMAERRWPRAARVARRHLSSRVLALTMLPRAFRHRAALGPLARHTFGMARRH